jgi:hypothetical protein
MCGTLWQLTDGDVERAARMLAVALVLNQAPMQHQLHDEFDGGQWYGVVCPLLVRHSCRLVVSGFFLDSYRVRNRIKRLCLGRLRCRRSSKRATLNLRCVVCLSHTQTLDARA